MTTGELIKRLQAVDPKGKLPVMVATDDGKVMTSRLAIHVHGVPARRDSHSVRELDASIQDGRHTAYVGESAAGMNLTFKRAHYPS